MAAAALALSGCTFLSPPRAFLLPPPPEPFAQVPGLDGRLIAVPRVSLPAYAAEGRIAILSTGEDGSPSVSQSGTTLWADTPERALTLALADALEARTGAAVLAEPWPIEADPDLKVGVVVSEAVGALEGPLTFRGDIQVSDLRLNGLAIVRSFEIEVPVTEPDITGLMAAHSAAIGLLADEIANALADRFSDGAEAARAPGPI